jgi:hypothetical protein
VEDKRVEGENEQGDPPFWGHKDEARFVPGLEIDPAAPESTDGEGGPVKFDEYLYELVDKPKKLDLGRARGSLCFRGSEGG